ncbi:MAG: AMP-binding protein [Eubacteriaceae bacterium]|nr:AMP-binding protein [Eubacteriaceae bacterium]
MIKIKECTPVFDSIEHENLRDMVNYAATAYDEDIAFIIKQKLSKKEFTYENISFRRFRDEIYAFGTALMKKGLLGKRVAILANNRYEWMLSHFAIVCGLGISVPLDKGLPYDELESSIIRSSADAIIFDAAHREMVEQLKDSNNTKLVTYICMDELEDYEDVQTLVNEGEDLIEAGDDSYSKLPIDKDAMAILLFTSGTTSLAKAVMLSHYNITYDVYAMLKVEDIRHGDVNMAFLPYHHTFGATGQFVMIAAGATTAFCDGLKYVQKNIVEYKVSVFVCVPLLIESIYKRIMATVKKEGKEKKLQAGIKLSRFLLKLGIDRRRQIFKDIHEQLGGNLRYVISGASALDPVAAKGFYDFGILAYQGYGMTEASPCICAETSLENKAGSIGRSMPGIEAAIYEPDENGIGELIARGPNVMLGYYENEEETANVIQDGWLHTGDLVRVDEEGFIFICGRKKNVIVLKNGKNVFPEELEILIGNLPYVEDSMVFGQPRFENSDEKDLALAAKIVYNKDVIRDAYGTEDPAEIEAIVRRDIDHINEQLPSYKVIHRLIVTDEPMIKTTTGKVKRYEEMKKNN